MHLIAASSASIRASPPSRRAPIRRRRARPARRWAPRVPATAVSRASPSASASRALAARSRPKIAPRARCSRKFPSRRRAALSAVRRASQSPTSRRKMRLRRCSALLPLPRRLSLPLPLRCSKKNFRHCRVQKIFIADTFEKSNQLNKNLFSKFLLLCFVLLLFKESRNLYLLCFWLCFLFFLILLCFALLCFALLCFALLCFDLLHTSITKQKANQLRERSVVRPRLFRVEHVGRRRHDARHARRTSRHLAHIFAESATHAVAAFCRCRHRRFGTGQDAQHHAAKENSAILRQCRLGAQPLCVLHAQPVFAAGRVRHNLAVLRKVRQNVNLLFGLWFRIC